MQKKRIVIIQGHPTPGGGCFCHALAEAYARGAAEGGHETRLVPVAELSFPLVRTKDEWDRDQPPPDIAASQQDIAWAQHLVIFYPLWLGTKPAVLKGFLEQTFRPGFAIGGWREGRMEKLLTGRSARVVVTMGMPAFVYRWYFGAHSLKSLERNILNFCGISPIRESLIGRIEASARKRQDWLEKMQALGRRGA
ncbi:NAD(P)H-dependent oxidoreductase [Telmatospirillum sp. J64-1]|uniref:NAD(P)H-dependent oxidoreductase n=1 Tax=Telmatospirillum sp. J64-1 TaxID=2502183 RepID=UPI00115EA0C9|nr:NAD(P)H-dependent oxidoreductase [Telmatospirillum sp. J64-1]